VKESGDLVIAVIGDLNTLRQINPAWSPP